MPPFFPHSTDIWKVHEPSSLRRLTLSLVGTAAITGVALRLLRALALTSGPSESWLYLVGTFALGAVLFFGMATLHLGNYTLRRWVWRVPAFAAVEAAAEMGTSALLIAAGVEPLGTSQAGFRDWPAMAANAALIRLAALIAFALVLAGVVQLVRSAMARKGEGRAAAARARPERGSPP
jgi:hypothetical protein